MCRVDTLLFRASLGSAVRDRPWCLNFEMGHTPAQGCHAAGFYFCPGLTYDTEELACPRFFTEVLHCAVVGARLVIPTE